MSCIVMYLTISVPYSSQQIIAKEPWNSTGSPYLNAAKEVANYLGTVHHEFHCTVYDGIDAIEDVIYHIETYNVTTIRAKAHPCLAGQGRSNHWELRWLSLEKALMRSLEGIFTFIRLPGPN
ncbi:asparagine synthetase [glutamine-hydrolyzing] [Senna tora]|uniref:Asparagine synthetase [glutamine-hydrolyzing] n=1 Tax=Senna tora TaxID=362788 RepID=A0A834W660_9FABA|nr:asparagine synthetase [glutamine-hydrolyzing] [Senna tora]